MGSFLSIKPIWNSRDNVLLHIQCQFNHNANPLYHYWENIHKLGKKREYCSFFTPLSVWWDHISHSSATDSYGTITVHTSSDTGGLCYCDILQCRHIILVLSKYHDQKMLMTDHGDSKITQKQELQTNIHLITKHVRYTDTLNLTFFSTY